MLFSLFLFPIFTCQIENSNADKQNKPNLVVKDFFPKKGTIDGGFQFYVHLENTEDLPLWIKIDEKINSAVNEGRGIYYVWAPRHEKGKVNVEVSRDGIHWIHACELNYSKENQFGSLFIIIIIGAMISVGFQAIKRMIKKKFKKSKSENGERKSFLQKSNQKSASNDSFKSNYGIL